ncbi:MAG: Fe(2+)-trafficking protein [Acidobacteriota bacterium]
MSFTCSRCGNAAVPMEQPPIPSDVGREIQSKVCPACWQQWLQTQVILINEYRLSLGDPGARRALERQMREFLSLGQVSSS